MALLARQALAARPQVNAALLADEYPNDFARIIGLHTYSQSPHRDYDIQLTGNWVERGGFRFEDFILTRRRGGRKWQPLTCWKKPRITC